jgi:hypothetical protein
MSPAAAPAGPTSGCSAAGAISSFNLASGQSPPGFPDWRAGEEGDTIAEGSFGTSGGNSG